MSADILIIMIHSEINLPLHFIKFQNYKSLMRELGSSSKSQNQCYSITQYFDLQFKFMFLSAHGSRVVVSSFPPVQFC